MCRCIHVINFVNERGIRESVSISRQYNPVSCCEVMFVLAHVGRREGGGTKWRDVKHMIVYNVYVHTCTCKYVSVYTCIIHAKQTLRHLPKLQHNSTTPEEDFLGKYMYMYMYVLRA